MNKKKTDDEKKIAQIMGKRLLIFRNHLGLSQVELAKKIGITYRSISQWESGKAAIPTRYLVKICKDFKISMAYFDPQESGFDSFITKYDRSERAVIVQTNSNNIIGSKINQEVSV